MEIGRIGKTVIEGVYQGKKCLHEIVVVGYDITKDMCYYIDSSDGLYNYIQVSQVKN